MTTRLQKARKASASVGFGAEGAERESPRESPAEKTRRVQGVFDAVVDRYDCMNEIMSLGSQRLLKRMAVEMARLRPGKRVLDLAGGTGDMAALAVRRMAAAGGDGRVVLADINRPMLRSGRDRLLDRGCAGVDFTQADAAMLPFAEDAFDAVLVAFGLRNFADKPAALGEMLRVLRPGGVAVVLEFSTVQNRFLASAFAAFQASWPAIGRVVVGNGDPYRYLVDSIREHPSQAELSELMETAGFVDVEHHNLLAGAAAIHRGCK